MFELGGIILLGVLAQWLAWRLKIPAILPLILTGLCVGPVAEYLGYERLIVPVFDESTGRGVFPGNTLFYFISLAIGLILFEGGLTLKRHEIKGVGDVITRLVTIGSIVTFIVGGIAAHLIMGLSWQISFLFSSLIIVTGPTVITPILRNLNLNRNVSTVLKWEGIIIDPIGALVAVLVFEFIISESSSQAYSQEALIEFLKIILIGTVLGATSAYALYQMIKKEWIPHYLLNPLTLAIVLGVFMLSDLIAHESGLLTVVVMGLVLGNLEVPYLKEILNFKESITVLLISTLFILLSANMTVDELMLINSSALLLFLVVVFLIRPLGVFLSTQASNLQFREKLFVSWVGPRGIVAAGVASLFGLKLQQLNVPGAEMITPLVFLIVLGTVLLNAATAGPMANWLGVSVRDSSSVMIIGANEAARVVADAIRRGGRRVVLVDNSASNVEEASKQGLEALQYSIYDEGLMDIIELTDIRYLLAMTASDEVNTYAAHRLKETFGQKGAYRLMTKKEIGQSNIAANVLFSPLATPLYLSRLIRQNFEAKSIGVANQQAFISAVKSLRERKSVPLFYIGKDGSFEVMTTQHNSFTIKGPGNLIYLGNEAVQAQLNTEPDTESSSDTNPAS